MASDKQTLTAEDERDLVLCGFVAFEDPPDASAAESWPRSRQSGVAIKILTGDGELMTRTICDQVGIPKTERLVLGDELDRLSDDALVAVAEQTDVFARVSVPEEPIIRALKRKGHVVGYIGDGINDAPSLHAADVGISVSNGVDVAKAAADVILLEKSLAAIYRGVVEGRRSFGNITKYVLMGTSSNFGNMLSMAVAAAFLPFLPLLPAQILLNNFLYDLSQLSIPTDNVDRELRGPSRASGTWADPALHVRARVRSARCTTSLPSASCSGSSTRGRSCSGQAGSSSRLRPRRWSSSSSVRRATRSRAGRVGRW